MTDRWVVVVRPLLPTQPAPCGYWAGPDDPDDYATCLTARNLITGQTDYAAVATFADPGTAWSIWTQHHGHTVGRNWVREIHQLDSIEDWSGLPPRITPQAHRRRRGLR